MGEPLEGLVVVDRSCSIVDSVGCCGCAVVVVVECRLK
jgi:hypothetical protein